MLAACRGGDSNPGQRRLGNECGTIESATRLLPWSGQGALPACQLNWNTSHEIKVSMRDPRCKAIRRILTNFCVHIGQLRTDSVEVGNPCSYFSLDLPRDVRQGHTEKCHLACDVFEVDFFIPLSTHQPSLRRF